MEERDAGEQNQPPDGGSSRVVIVVENGIDVVLVFPVSASRSPVNDAKYCIDSTED